MKKECKQCGKCCKDFIVNCGNSDAACFKADGDYPILSAITLYNNPDICDYCPYNKKYEDWDYNKWKEHEEQFERIKKLKRILKDG